MRKLVGVMLAGAMVFGPTFAWAEGESPETASSSVVATPSEQESTEQAEEEASTGNDSRNLIALVCAGVVALLAAVWVYLRRK
ncbi:MAG: type VII secretion EssA family protein [Propionibacteriaceae bacterium]|jgi:hypothetical protein|nr:type VII secretion EssA family protein [Propionibacteriaceae bacterium]